MRLQEASEPLCLCLLCMGQNRVFDCVLVELLLEGYIRTHEDMYTALRQVLRWDQAFATRQSTTAIVQQVLLRGKRLSFFEINNTACHTALGSGTG